MFYGDVSRDGGGPEITYDKIYSSRYEMETFAKEDGVYFGRNVLVEYSEKPTVLYKNLNDKQQVQECEYYAKIADIITSIQEHETFINVPIENLYIDKDCNSKIKISSLQEKQVCHIIFVDKLDPQEPSTIYHHAYGIISTEEPKPKDSQAETKKCYILGHSNEQGFLNLNDSLDRNQYLLKYNERSYDSTVWQKTYVYNSDGTGEEVYLMIAELNAVAPTMAFKMTKKVIGYKITEKDKQSTQEVIPYEEGLTETEITKKIEEAYKWVESAPQGEVRKFITNYNSILPPTILTGDSTSANYEMRMEEPWDIQLGNINFNEDNMEPGKYNDQLPKEDSNQIYTTIGLGNPKLSYYNYDPLKDIADPIENASEKIPTHKKINIEIPGLGEAVAKMWNQVYGTAIEGKRYTNVNWNIGDPDNPRHRLVNYDDKSSIINFNTKDGITTIAGCINSVQDLIGRIIIEENPGPVAAKEDKIYYFNNTFNRKGYTYIYSPVGTLNKWDENTRYYVTADSNNRYPVGMEWTKPFQKTQINENGEIIPRIPNGVILGTKTAEAKWIEIPSLAKEMTTIHGMLLKLWNIISKENNYGETDNSQSLYELKKQMECVLSTMADIDFQIIDNKNAKQKTIIADVQKDENNPGSLTFVKDKLVNILLDGIKNKNDYGFKEHINNESNINDALNNLWDHISFGIEDPRGIEESSQMRPGKKGDIYIMLPQEEKGGNK